MTLCLSVCLSVCGEEKKWEQEENKLDCKSPRACLQLLVLFVWHTETRFERGAQLAFTSMTNGFSLAKVDSSLSNIISLASSVEQWTDSTQGDGMSYERVRKWAERHRGVKTEMRLKKYTSTSVYVPMA